MRLSAEQFETILSSLRSFSEREGSSEKRRAPRVGLRMSATLVHCNGKPGNVQKHTVKLRDVSSEGIGLTHTQPIAAGSYVLVTFDRASGEQLSVLYRVAHCERLGDRTFAVGARLDRVLTAQELDNKRYSASA